MCTHLIKYLIYDSFLQKEKINRIKHQEHLKTISLAQIYCPIKLIIFGTKIANSKKYIYIFKHNPFKEFLENYFGINIYKYFNHLFPKKKIYKREFNTLSGLGMSIFHPN